MIVRNKLPRPNDVESVRQRFIETIARQQTLLDKRRKLIRRLETRLASLESRIELLSRTGCK